VAVSQQAGPAGGAATEGEEWSGNAVAVAAVQALFVTLGKTFRAYQLYDENNPVRRRFLDQLRSEFLQFWTDHDRLAIRVGEDHLYLGDVEVYRAESRNDSLAFLFFKDGVREITFLPGIETHELERFLGVLQKARKLVPEGDDLLTVLWEADLRFFEYQYVDVLAEGVSLPEPGRGNSPTELQRALAAEDAELAAQETPAERRRSDRTTSTRRSTRSTAGRWRSSRRSSRRSLRAIRAPTCSTRSSTGSRSLRTARASRRSCGSSRRSYPTS
jgi:hypothetical protein